MPVSQLRKTMKLVKANLNDTKHTNDKSAFFSMLLYALDEIRKDSEQSNDAICAPKFLCVSTVLLAIV